MWVETFSLWLFVLKQLSELCWHVHQFYSSSVFSSAKLSQMNLFRKFDCAGFQLLLASLAGIISPKDPGAPRFSVTQNLKWSNKSNALLDPAWPKLCVKKVAASRCWLEVFHWNETGFQKGTDAFCHITHNLTSRCMLWSCDCNRCVFSALI